MTDESNNVPQAEPIAEIDLIHLSGLSPERFHALSDEDRANWERVFRASGAKAGAHEAAQGRRRVEGRRR
ncbi:hypothetical protein [Methylocapsa aurea]|uniref:hypothetical protein n=1 Tax=Methylocapsa aurea TaxID=663610 RepID=UPI003D1881BC